MPDSNDVFDRMEGSWIFSTLDFASAYWSIPLRKEDKECTAFVSARGQYEFNRMPFGLCNSLATYQRALDNVLQEATNAEAFVDDIIIHCGGFAAHLNHLDQVPQLFGESRYSTVARQMQVRLSRSTISLASSVRGGTPTIAGYTFTY